MYVIKIIISANIIDINKYSYIGKSIFESFIGKVKDLDIVVDSFEQKQPKNGIIIILNIVYNQNIDNYIEKIKDVSNEILDGLITNEKNLPESITYKTKRRQSSAGISLIYVG